MIENLLAFVPSQALTRPWTVITYMFLHGGFGHILFNMLALFFFGPRVESRLGSRRFATLYFVSGIMGAVLSIFFAPHVPIIGASGAVFGVMLAFARFWPRDQILIWGILPVEARVMVIAMTAMAVVFGFTGDAIGGGALRPSRRLRGRLALSPGVRARFRREEVAGEVRPRRPARIVGVDPHAVAAYPTRQPARSQSRRAGPDPRQDQLAGNVESLCW